MPTPVIRDGRKRLKKLRRGLGHVRLCHHFDEIGGTIKGCVSTPTPDIPIVAVTPFLFGEPRRDLVAGATVVGAIPGS